jgi:hypothetical protein
MGEIIFRYFSCVVGKVVPRHGTDTMIGVRPSKKTGWEWFPKEIVRIPKDECTRYLREYRRAFKEGALVEHTKKDYEKAEAALEKAAAQRVKDRKAAEAKKSGADGEG